MVKSTPLCYCSENIAIVYSSDKHNVTVIGPKLCHNGNVAKITPQW